MPFAALCKRCKCVFLAKKLYTIRSDIHDHFIKNHSNASLKRDPLFIKFYEFKSNFVDLVHDYGHEFTFQSRQYYDQDYVVSVITWDEYRDCIFGKKTDEELYDKLSHYF